MIRKDRRVSLYNATIALTQCIRPVAVPASNVELNVETEGEPREGVDNGIQRSPIHVYRPLSARSMRVPAPSRGLVRQATYPYALMRFSGGQALGDRTMYSRIRGCGNST